MSGIVEKIVKPTAEILEHIGRKIPNALGKAHDRVGQMAHKAADHFDKVEADLEGKARIHSPHSSPHEPHEPHVGGPPGTRGGRRGGRDGRGGRGARQGSGDRDRTGRPSGSRCEGGDPIDLASGEMLMYDTDLELPGDLPLVLQRTHVSGYRSGRFFGPSWASTLDERLEADGQGLVLATEDGMLLVYPVPGADQAVLPSHGPRWPLTWDGTPGGEILVSDPVAGTTRHFSPPAEGSTAPFELPLTAITDRNGNRITVERDAAGAPVAIQHSGGYRIAVDTQDRRVTALRVVTGDRQTILRSFRYDAAGDLTHIVNRSGQAMVLDNDERGRITRWTDRVGSWYSFRYDESDRCVEGTGADGFLDCTLAYDDEARTTTYTDSLGRATTYRYNDAYQIVSVTDPLGHTTVQTWDDDNRLATVTDPLGRTTRCEYDEAGNLTRVRRPDGTAETTRYNELNLPVEVTGPGGGVWRYTYDDRGNLLTSVDPSGATTRGSYDEHGRLTGVTDELGRVQRIETDAAGLPVASTDPAGLRTVIERDPLGRVTGVTDPLGQVLRQGYGTEGEPAWVTYPDGSTETWETDAEGNETSHTDTTGNTTRYTHTHFGLVTSRTDPDGTVHTFTYDTELDLTRITNPLGRTWEYEHDAAGRITAETDFNGRRLTYAYDAAGQPVSRGNGAGETITLVNDALGRIVEKRAEGYVATFTYDANGDLVRAVNPDADVAWTRDPVGRITAERVGAGDAAHTTTYTYDAAGNPLTRTTPGGTTSEWTYDRTGLPARLTTRGRTLEFRYDELGRETERRFGDRFRLSQTWDSADRLTGQTVAGATAALQRRTYTYRADGYLTRIGDAVSGTRRFALDPAGRVTTVNARDWTEKYVYDEIGNVSYAEAPGLDASGERELTGTLTLRAGRTGYEYDGQGRLVRRTRHLLSGRRRVWSFTWGAEDRLTDCVTPDGTRWHYTYDAIGRRTAKRRMAEDGSVADEIRFVWDGTRLAEQTDSSGETTTWDYEPDTHRPLTQVSSSASDTDARFHVIVTDLVGAPTEIVDEHGRLTWQSTSTLWGLPASGDTPASGCPLRFPGQYHDVETGFSYNYFRYYDPETATFTAPDPLGLDPADNDRAYVNNPQALSDPLGLAGQTCKSPKKKLVYVTYTKTHPTTGKIYSGRTMGRAPVNADGSVSQREINKIVTKRGYNHHMNKAGFGPGRADKYAVATKGYASRHSDPAYQAIRGREQNLIDHHGGAQTEKGGTSGNPSRGIGLTNSRRDLYLKAGHRRFGKL